MILYSSILETTMSKNKMESSLSVQIYEFQIFISVVVTMYLTKLRYLLHKICYIKYDIIVLPIKVVQGKSSI